MKWRNSEGREFSVWDEGNSSGTRFSYANVSGFRVSRVQMERLGYELVEDSPDSSVTAEQVGAPSEISSGALSGVIFTVEGEFLEDRVYNDYDEVGVNWILVDQSKTSACAAKVARYDELKAIPRHQRGTWNLHHRKDSVLVTAPNGETEVWDEGNPPPLVMPNHPCDSVTTTWDEGCMPFGEMVRQAWAERATARIRRTSAKMSAKGGAS